MHALPNNKTNRLRKKKNLKTSLNLFKVLKIIPNRLSKKKKTQVGAMFTSRDTFYDRIGSETLLFVPEHARGPKLFADVFEACICMKETCFQHHLLQTLKLQALKFDFSKLQTSKLQASNKTLRTCLQTFFSISNVKGASYKEATRIRLCLQTLFLYDALSV